MLRPLHPASNASEFKCYLWALLNQAQLPDLNFYPCISKCSYVQQFSFDFALIKVVIYVHKLEPFFVIPDAVWIAYLTAYGIPEKEQRDYYIGIPF
ncbi:hypothetical protein F7734_52825 [Scytonema sp. UIC 10036]|uniref:hypothetical protein n=1 Tax=Scytonema sp. UIC 10036 TaxID=2304196 RepID=UPI0012DA7C4B|nr:hypothetical protein [Scytonema sp. UIC 10036]MUH00500.1 hypothetical protein [Scytonema sp. UIC 10036]